MSFTGGSLTLSNGTITALGGSNLNLVTSGGGVVQVNGSLIESQGNFDILQAQVTLNQANIGAPNSNVLFPTLYTGLTSALSGGANDSTARASAGNALSGNANDATARTALSGSANDSTARTSASNAQTTANGAGTLAGNAQTTANQAREFTLGGTTIAGAITYDIAPSVAIAQDTWLQFTTIQIKVPPNWTIGSGLSVNFDGYAYYNFDAPVASYFAIYYNSPPLQLVYQPLIGNTSSGITDAIFGGNQGQAYLPLTLTIPPTYLTSASGGGLINIQINGRVTSPGHQLVSNPLIDARVGLVFP